MFKNILITFLKDKYPNFDFIIFPWSKDDMDIIEKKGLGRMDPRYTINMYLEHASQVYARSSREQQTEILTLAVNRVDKFIKMKCKIIEEYKDENIEWV